MRTKSPEKESFIQFSCIQSVYAYTIDSVWYNSIQYEGKWSLAKGAKLHERLGTFILAAHS